MSARLLALAIALCTGATGVLPVGGFSRCVAMDGRMAAGDESPAPVAHDCCPKCDAPPRSIGTPCCETLPGRLLDARGQGAAQKVGIAPSPLTGILTFAGSSSCGGRHAQRLTRTLPFRPPGEQLERLSAILRI